jgi:hypothetical protein
LQGGSEQHGKEKKMIILFLLNKIKASNPNEKQELPLGLTLCGGHSGHCKSNTDQESKTSPALS